MSLSSRVDATPTVDARPPLWEHQRRALAVSGDRCNFALFLEQRTGKTRVVIETVARLNAKGAVRAMLIIAPNEVHYNWLADELPRWATFHWRGHIWVSNRARRASSQDEREALLVRTDEVAVLAVNVEALRLDDCFAYCAKFMKTYPTMLVIDESQVIATPGAKQTKRARALAPRAAYRRILTGTPATENPFQLYSQFACLDTSILNFNSYAAFKARYGEWEEGYNYTQGRSFPKLKEDKSGKKLYRNLDELRAKIAAHSFRVRRDECADLPPKIYQKVWFDLTPVQRSAYDQLRDQARTELRDGRTVTAALVLTRWVRLQQVASNYWPAATGLAWHAPCDGEGCEACDHLGVVEQTTPIMAIDPDNNPRLAAAAKLILEEPGSIIVWARFHQDVTDVIAWCASHAVPAVRYDGTVGKEDRRQALAGFQGGAARVIVATTGALGRGRDLSRAKMLIYYSNNFSLEQRLQSEDRAEKLTQITSTQVIDLVAKNTVDERIVDALRNKRSLSALLAGDPQQDWL